jgi:hypothetical protein
LPAVVHAWRAFFDAHDAADKPLWITEFGYPSDPAYQHDPAYRSGAASQASYLRRALPALLDAGAAKIFVTLRDNLTGQFASEGVIAGAVADPPQPEPRVVRKPAFVALTGLAASRSLRPVTRDEPRGRLQRDFLTRPARFERATFGSGDRRSIP